MTQKGGEAPGLPSFFKENPWLDILAQRGAEPEPDFVSSSMPSSLTAREAAPIIETEPAASSPATPVVSFPRELVVRLKMSPELVKAIREFKEAIIMALSVSQHQATIVPIYIPISVAQMASQAPPQAPGHASAEASGKVVCPKCGRPGKLYEHRRGKRTYVLVLHGRQKCYLGPADKVKVKWPSLAERALLHNAPQHWAGILSPGDLRPSPLVWSTALPPEWAPLAKRWCPGRDSNPGPAAREAAMLPDYTTGAREGVRYGLK